LASNMLQVNQEMDPITQEAQQEAQATSAKK
jgi:hypothetical protein